MYVYTTYRIEKIGCYNVSVPGPPIIAYDSEHAHDILLYIGKGDHLLDTKEHIEPIKDSKVVLDGFLIPNKAQLN
jgi:hypothetical protein